MDYYNDNLFGELFNDPSFMAGIGMFVTIFAVIMFISAAVGLILYILRSIGLYRLAENRGMSGAGLAWIPIFGSYRIGSIADDIAEREGSKTYFRYLLLGGKIISIVFSTVSSGAVFSSFANLMDNIDSYGYSGRGLPGSFVAANSISSLVSLVGLATFVITIIALNKIYKTYRPSSSTAWTVLSVIFSFMQSIFPFVIRNDVPMPSGDMNWNGPAPQGFPQQGGYYQQQGGQWPTPPANPGYPPQPPYQPTQPVNSGGYYPPNAPEPPTYQPPKAPEQSSPTPPWEGGPSND